MEEKNFAMETVISVRLDRLAYFVLRSWRRILKSAFLLALLGAVVASVLNVVVFCSEERRTQVENEYYVALFSHEVEGKNLKIEIQNLYESIQQQETYNANSILMQIDPYNKYMATMTYYVDTDYQIMPEYQYQNIDYGPRLVQMYTEYLTGGEMYSAVANSLKEPSDVRFIEELFNISTYHNMGMLEIQVCAVSQEMCQEIIDIISKGMTAKYSQADRLIGDHALMELNRNISSEIDPVLDATQKENIQAVTDATMLLSEKREALEEWKEKPVPKDPGSVKCIVKTILKASCIGALLGALLVMTLETVSYLTGDRIIGTPEFRDRCALPVLGELPEEAREKGRVARWVDRIGKVTLCSSNVKMLVAVAVENIYITANTGKIPIKRIGLIGSIPPEKLEYITTEFQRFAGNRFEFIAAGNPLDNASAANLIRQTDAVVLIEEQRSATYTNVERECEQMNRWGMKVLGIVFTNVDAK